MYTNDKTKRCRYGKFIIEITVTSLPIEALDAPTNWEIYLDYFECPNENFIFNQLCHI